MNNQKAEAFLKNLLSNLKNSQKRWCKETVDDSEDILTEYPELIDSLIPEIEEILEIPLSGLIIHSAYYGSGESTKSVKEILDWNMNFNSINLRVDNHSMNGDPAPNKVKELSVDYSFEGKQNQIKITEGKTLILP
jgi:hypothetical protein